jgi:hypothetical protein
MGEWKSWLPYFQYLQHTVHCSQADRKGLFYFWHKDVHFGRNCGKRQDQVYECTGLHGQCEETAILHLLNNNCRVIYNLLTDTL